MNIPYGKQTITQADINTVANKLKSDYLTTGSTIQEFETQFANYIGCKYAVAINSGTAALHCAAYAAGLDNNQLLQPFPTPSNGTQTRESSLHSPITFLSNPNMAYLQGARIHFADTNDQGLISLQSLQQQINTHNFKTIFLTEYSGIPYDYDKIFDMIKYKNPKPIIISDAAHALGATYKGKKVGNITDITTFSFHPVKHITTGEGGMMITNNHTFYKKALQFRNHNMIKTEKWMYQMHQPGFNYRMTDFQAALGINQLKNLPKFLKKRQKIADFYYKSLKNLQITLPQRDSNVFHLFVIQTDRRDELYTYLKSQGIHVQIHYFPVNEQPFYKKNRALQSNECPNAMKFYQRCLSLPIYPTLTQEEQEYTVDAIHTFFKEAQE